MNTNDNASIEIDVLYLLRKLWSKKFFIIFVGLLVGTIALLGSVFFIKPKYTSTTRIYVVSRSSDTSLTNQDLQAGSYLVNDYKEVITSSEVLSSLLAVAAIQVLLTKTFKQGLTWLTTTRKLSHQVKSCHQLSTKKNSQCLLVNFLKKLR